MEQCALVPPALQAPGSEVMEAAATNLAAELFLKFRDLIVKILIAPMEEKDISTALQLTEVQTREWLERLIAEGVVRRSAKSRYEIHSASKRS